MDYTTPQDPNAHPEQILEKIFLFQNWREVDLQAVAHFTGIRKAERGELLFLQEESCQHLFILILGRIQIFRTTSEGREIILNVVHPGGLVACAALFLDFCFPASARVISQQAELLALEGSGFLRLLSERPDLAKRMIGSLALRLGELANRLESQSTESATIRLANWLLDQPGVLLQSNIRQIQVKESKKSIAANLGITPETLSRCLRKLAEEGMIAVKGKRIELLDPIRLLSLINT
ncbi:MAG: Crp/Fnr family transcriptional regulator [bacterium]